MTKRKRRSIFDDWFGSSIFDELEDMFDKAFSSLEGGLTGSYSIQVTYTDKGPVVYAELSDDMDADEFRKMLEQKYPGAKIVIKGGKSSEKFKVVKKEKEEKRVGVPLESDHEEESKEESLFDLLHGKKRTFIKRED